MMNTGIHPTHQNKGIYKRLLPKILEILKEKGFQKVYSRHKATNNQIIIPKLRAGFLITNFEMSDIHGVLIHLTYYFNETRRKIMEYRVGNLQPDQTIRQALSLHNDPADKK
jgi:ribosomal protein S18 acetylase RimI-like enzyme